MYTLKDNLLCEGINLHITFQYIKSLDMQINLLTNTDLEQICYESVVGHLEDGRLRVFVDGDDDLTVLHAS